LENQGEYEFEELYRNIIQLTPNAIYVHTKGKFLYSNPAGLALLGAKNLEELASRAVIDYVHPDYREMVIKRIKDMELDKKDATPLQEKLVKLDNSVIDVEVVGRAIKYMKGHANLLIVRDLTQQIENQERLKESEARKSAILESLPDLVFLLNSAGIILDFNAPDESQLYINRDEVFGSNILDVLPKNEAKMILEKVRFVLETKGTTLLEFQLLMNQTLQTFESRFIYYGDNEVIALVRNISKEKAEEEEQIKIIKMESIGLLAGGIAHDFNNILMKILGNINLIKLESKISKSDNLYLKEVENAITQATKLTNQLLTFSKGGEPITKPIAIKTIIEDSVSFFLSGSKSKVKTSYSEDSITVEVEAGQIDQLINNLILNADQSMPEGGVIEINVELMRLKKDQFPGIKKGKYVKIAIKDQGIGIEEKNLGRIFEPYFTTKKEGTGLGLAICYSVVKRHKGFIEVKSEVEKGSVFIVYLPVSSKKIEDKGKQKILDKNWGSGRALIMDDSVDIQILVKKMLEMMGFTCDVASDGEEAIEIYKKAMDENPFKIVIMDLTIPGGMGGKKVLEELLTFDPKIKAIVSSGYSTDPVMANYKKHGFKGILTKPYTFDELKRVIGEILG
jgi:PAS domain S-box-containing protein